MRFRNLLLAATLVASSVPLAAPGLGNERGEKVVKLESIPAPARQTILQEANGAPILKVEMEKEKSGRTLYEAHVKRGKDEIGIVVDAQGTLVGKHSEKDEKKER
jgi:hypothetical protein